MKDFRRLMRTQLIARGYRAPPASLLMFSKVLTSSGVLALAGVVTSGGDAILENDLNHTQNFVV